MAEFHPQEAPARVERRGRGMTVHSQDSGRDRGEATGREVRTWSGSLRTGLGRKSPGGPESPLASLTKGSSERAAAAGSISGHRSLTASPAHPGSSSSYDSGFPAGDHELFTTFSWEDKKVRRVFIRKVTASPQLPRSGLGVENPLERPWPGTRPAEARPPLLRCQLTAPAGSASVCFTHCTLLLLSTSSLLSR